MKAMVLHGIREPLKMENLPDPEPAPGQILIRVEACGICRTDLHIIDGEVAAPKFPLVLGHEIIGRVMRLGAGVIGLEIGQRVGVPWLGSTCNDCIYCDSDLENLCENALFTGLDINGGYAEYCVADTRYCFALDGNADAAHLAPFMCAGIIGYRALRFTGDADTIGIYGFGAAAHLIAQVAIFDKIDVYAFTRPGDSEAQNLARAIGCTWVGGSDEVAPEELDAALIFAPIGELIPTALKAIRKGGAVICAGIHMTQIPAFDYKLLWGERSIKSIANLTRRDAIEFLDLANRIPVVSTVTSFPLSEANHAIEQLRSGTLTGAAVLIP